MQFRAAVESDPNSAKAHWGLARAYENLGRFNETVEELRKTVELDDANLDAKAKLGNYFLLVQPPLIEETQELRDEILAADNSFIEGHILSASILAAEGRPENEVVDVVNKAIALNPKRIESYISLQRLYMTREKAGEAEAAIKRGIENCPDSYLGYIEYGRFLMYSSRDEDAETQFNKALALDPASIEAREAVAEFYVTSRQIGKAEKAYVELVSLQEDSPESRLVLAEFYSKVDRENDAIDTLDRILAETPEYVLARYRIADIYLKRKEASKVEEHLAALFKINDDDLDALMLRAKLRLQQSRAEDAVKDLEEVLKKTPSDRDPLYLMAQAKLAAGQIEQANAFLADLERYHPNYLHGSLIRIQAAFTANDASTALRLANELVKKASTAVPNADMPSQMIEDIRVRAISSRGLANLELGRIAEAKVDLTEVAKRSPRSSTAAVNLARVLAAEKNFDGALAAYEKAIAMDSRNFDAISGTVNMAIKLNRSAKAKIKLDELLAENQDDKESAAALHYLRSTVASAERDDVETERQLSQAIEIDPDYLPAYSAYASFLAGRNRTNEAVEKYRQVTERRPAAAVFTMLGILEDSRSNSNEAEKAYRRALELAPDSAIAANNLAWLMAERQGNLDEALRLATLAISKSQPTANFHDTLGWIYLKKGLVAPAVEQFRKAVAIEESTARKTGTKPNPAYRERLGIAMAKAGGRNLG